MSKILRKKIGRKAGARDVIYSILDCVWAMFWPRCGAVGSK